MPSEESKEPTTNSRHLWRSVGTISQLIEKNNTVQRCDESKVALWPQERQKSRNREKFLSGLFSVHYRSVCQGDRALTVQKKTLKARRKKKTVAQKWKKKRKLPSSDTSLNKRDHPKRFPAPTVAEAKLQSCRFVWPKHIYSVFFSPLSTLILRFIQSLFDSLVTSVKTSED